jgi:hypothetical protein
MKQAAEYRMHAAECRKLALGSKGEEERQQLLQMAETWEQMAENRERFVARQNPKDSN